MKISDRAAIYALSAALTQALETPSSYVQNEVEMRTVDLLDGI